MTQEIRNIQQNYWRHPDLPHVELRSTFESETPYKKHSHQEFSIGAILQGQTQSIIKNKNHLVQEGQLIVIEPNQTHSCNPLPDQKRSYHMLYLDAEWCLHRISELYGQSVDKIHCQQPLINDAELFKKYLLMVEATHHQTHSQVSHLIDEISFIAFSRYCAPSESIESDSGTADYMKLKLLDDLAAPPSLDDLSSELKQRKETIIRIFNRELGISPMAFLNNARIEQAKLKLKAGVDIIDVALQVGFSDQSHFHKTFVNYTSSTPRQYQKINF